MAEPHLSKDHSFTAPNALSSRLFLFVIRFCCFVVSAKAFAYTLSLAKARFLYKYFTMWGLTLTAFYFALVMVAYTIVCFKQSPLIEQFVSLVFQTALLWEIVITAVFWTLLWPAVAENGQVWDEFVFQSVFHLLPIACLGLEFSFNSLCFEWRFIWF